MNKHSGLRSAMVADDEEFEEAEVWEAVHDHQQPETKISNFMMKKKSKPFHSSLNSAKKKAPGCNHGCSSAMGAHHHHHHHHGGQTQSSGPLLTPNWSHNSGFSNPSGDQKQQDEDEDDGEMIPPHEWLARRLARSQISSSSVCEGAGRTLKGRDLSRVRNAVLTKTGFIEQ